MDTETAELVVKEDSPLFGAPGKHHDKSTGSLDGQFEKQTSDKLGKRANPSTQRTWLLRERYMAQRPSICVERSKLVTSSFRQTEAKPPVLRQALAFEKVLAEMPLWIADGELIVANIATRQRGAFLFPEYDDTWLEPELDSISTRSVDPWQLSEEDKNQLKECMDYWKGRNLAAITDGLTHDDVRLAEMNSFINVSMGKQGGLGHIVPDMEAVLSMGLNAKITQAEEHIGSLDLAVQEDYDKYHFLKAAIITDKAVVGWARRFAALARESASKEKDQQRKRELDDIANICERVPAEPARNFREALQAVAFIMASVQIETNGVSIGTGRLDQYCFPYFEKDLSEGVMTRSQAVELLECLFLKLAESNRVASESFTNVHSGYPFWIQVPVGGQTADRRDATNDLSYMIIDVSTNMQLAEPTVSARIHNRTPDRFLMKCCEAIKRHGGGNPALFNDEVIIPSQLANVPGITIEDAFDYSVIGCSEIAFAGKGPEGLAYQGLNCARVLALMMGGLDPVTGARLEAGPGDMMQWKTSDQMMKAYSNTVERITRIMFMQVCPLLDAHNTHRPSPYLSSLTRDCIKRGKSFYNGGSIYGNGVVNMCVVGIATLGNAIAAIKKLVFDDRVISMGQLQHALSTNFEDDATTPSGSDIRRLCLNAPKYGNDDPYVDNITKDCLNIIVNSLRAYRTRLGGHYRVTISPVSTHVVYGMLCGATPDGRKKGTPLSDSCSPSQGTDVSGPTATIKSVANLDHIKLAQGAIFNMRLHPATLDTKAGMIKWATLIRTYFDLGGWEIQFNVVDAETLRDAQKHPENYRDLVVRVVGYSAFFNELSKSVQDDIISRTEYAM